MSSVVCKVVCDLKPNDDLIIVFKILHNGAWSVTGVLVQHNMFQYAVSVTGHSGRNRLRLYDYHDMFIIGVTVSALLHL